MAEEPVVNVLFLCTGNSARSIMAQAVLAHLAGARVRAYSAGSHPTGAVNPLTLEALKRAQIPPPPDLRSKSWDEFAAPGAPKIDLVVTVCDSTAGEVCPVWPGHPVTVHWGFEDPAAARGSEAERLVVFERVLGEIRARLEAFVHGAKADGLLAAVRRS